jgi:two-component system, OmpR family, response regulator
VSASLQKVMLVEDDPDIQFIAKLTLQKLGGYQVYVASNGREALEQLPIFQPQLILLDMMMPEMDGLTVLRRIRTMSEYANVPIVFMTAKAQAHEIEEYKRSGIQDVITKPFEPNALKGRIEKVWQDFHIV